jgi:hypothetical protein
LCVEGAESHEATCGTPAGLSAARERLATLPTTGWQGAAWELFGRLCRGTHESLEVSPPASVGCWEGAIHPVRLTL